MGTANDFSLLLRLYYMYDALKKRSIDRYSKIFELDKNADSAKMSIRMSIKFILWCIILLNKNADSAILFNKSWSDTLWKYVEIYI